MDFDESNDDNTENQGDYAEEILLIEEGDKAGYKSKKDCVIFLLDCGATMLESHRFHKVLSVCESFLKTKIITNEKDIFGLIVYNTEITNNNFNFGGINVQIQLAPPDANLIRTIKQLQFSENEEDNKNKDNKDIYSLFPPAKYEVSLSAALTVCHSLLKNYDEKTHNKRIFLFTDRDNPMNGDFSERSITIQRAKDMLDSEIIIELFPLGESQFDMSKFYINITTGEFHEEDEENKLTDLNSHITLLSKQHCENKLSQLTKSIRQKEVKKRTLGSCPFFMTKDVKFNVNFFTTLKRTIKPRSYNVDARTNKSLNTITQQICKETGTILYQNQIGTFQPYGATKVPFTKDDMKKIKTLDSPGIKLMGFKSLESVKPYFNIRESYFLYPEEGNTGASQLCDALIKSLVSKNKVAIVKFIPREGANIRFCAMFPQKETFDEDYFQTPPGFNLVFLPYADELRSNEDIMNKSGVNAQEVSITKEQNNAAKKLIKKMNIDFDSRNFENPTIQKFYSTLEALALNETKVEEVVDYLQPDREALKSVLQGCDEEFNQVFWGDAERKIVRKEKNNNKRRAESSERSESSVTQKGGNKRSKKTIKEESNEDEPVVKESKNIKTASKTKPVKKEDGQYSVIELNSLIESGEIEKLTVKDLKAICQVNNIRFNSKSTKKDIIALIEQFVFSQIN